VHYKQEQYASLFFQTGKSHFSSDFQDQEGNDGNDNDKLSLNIQWNLSKPNLIGTNFCVWNRNVWFIWEKLQILGRYDITNGIVTQVLTILKSSFPENK